MFLIENVKKTYNFLQNLLLFWPQQTSIEKVCFLPFEKKLLKGKPPESTLWEVLEFTQSFAMLRNVDKEMLTKKCCREGGNEEEHLWWDSANSWTNGARFTKVLKLLQIQMVPDFSRSCNQLVFCTQQIALPYSQIFVNIFE